MKLSGLGLSHVVLESKKRLSSGFLQVFKYRLRHRLFNGQDSELLERDGIDRPPSVGVLLYDPVVDSVILVEQFRLGPYLANDDPWLLEIVAGISEPGETLEAVAHREVQEEAGCKVSQLMPLCDFYMSPGASSEKMKVYCGIVSSEGVEGVFGLDEEGEDIKVHVIPFEKAFQMVEDGDIANAPAVIALQWLKLHHHELGNK